MSVDPKEYVISTYASWEFLWTKIKKINIIRERKMQKMLILGPKRYAVNRDFAIFSVVIREIENFSTVIREFIESWPLYGILPPPALYPELQSR